MTKEIIIKSKLADMNIGDSDIFFHMWNALEKRANEVALIDAVTGNEITANEIKTAVVNIATNLHYNHGVGKGTIVSFYSSNSIELVLMLLAVWRLGGITSLMSAHSTPNEVKRDITRLGSKHIYLGKGATLALPTLKDTNIQTIFSIDSHPGCVSFSSLKVKTCKTLPNIFQPPQANDTCAILFSSGTTGLPKAVELKHALFAYFMHCFRYDSPVAFCKKDAYGILMLPMYHMYGLAVVCGSILSGSPLITFPSKDLELYAKLTHKYKVPYLIIVPPMAVALCKSGLLEQYDFSHVECVINGSAPLAADIEEELLAKMGGNNARLKQAYGLTEAGLLTGVPSKALMHLFPNFKRGTIGVLTPHMELKVVDKDSGKSLGPNQVGELVFRGPTFMRGYYNNIEATRDTIDENNWLYTGDLGYFDQNGWIYIVDRLKELIKYNAYQVPPSELEGIILTHPAVADVGVVGKPDPVVGELPMAWVVVKPGQKVTDADIKAFVADKVASYKKLRGGVKFVEEIPKSPSGKILRKLIMESVRMETKSKL